MIPLDTKAALLSDIPTAFAVKGETVNVSKKYLNQFTEEQYPSITLHYPSANVVDFDYLGYVRFQTQVTTDEKTYSTGTTKYTFDVIDADDIRKVTGIVSGSSYTFLSSEYQLLTSTNEIEFLGPNFPDDTTVFEATYHHHSVRQFYGAHLEDTLFVDVWAKDAVVNSTKINGIIMAEEIMRALWKWFKWTADVPGMLVLDISEVRDLDSLAPADYIRRRQFEAVIRHAVQVRIDEISIGDVNVTVQLP